MAKVGAPSQYTPEKGKEICDLIADGYSLRKIGRRDDMPERRTITAWEDQHPEFAAQIARARDCKVEDDADSLEEINQDVRDGVLDPQQAAIISNNIKWAAGKQKPKKYGDSTQIKHADADGNKLSVNSILQAINGKTTDIPNKRNRD
jgi:hypothetical protein